MALPASMSGGRRLYLVTPPRFEPSIFAQVLARALDAGPVAAVQIRLKSDDELLWAQATEMLAPVARDRGVAVFMTDRPDLANMTGCGGIQLTAANGDVAAARKAQGPGGAIGVVCDDDLGAAEAAVAAGADYVAFGALSGPRVQIPPTPARPETMRAWCSGHATPILAMGRLRPEGCRTMLEAGARFVAGIGAIWDHADGPAAGVREMNAAIEAVVGGS